MIGILYGYYGHNFLFPFSGWMEMRDLVSKHKIEFCNLNTKQQIYIIKRWGQTIAK